MTDVDRGAHYTAFLSYSHKDAAVARWLHRKLETYRIPSRLVGGQGERGEVPARLTPIFRDREELPAAGDLSEKVRAALAVSRNLIIVCSPHSATSPWVAKEIATFRELYPDRPIFSAIVEGEPNQCFSPALREGGTEPLAADLRPGRDGRKLGLLKLVAGISGVGLDALVQRDAQRHVRRVTSVTVGALVAMLIMAALTALALSARQEARLQKAEAEGLVEFMLTDLRNRLKGVGRLDVLTAVNERALGYYQRQSLEGMSPDSLERRARILHAMGEDDDGRGNLHRARAEFSEANRITAASLKAEPDSPNRIFAHAQSEYWLGLAAWRTNHVDEARRSFERYAELAQRLYSADPRNPEWILETAYAQSNLGTLLLREGGNENEAETRFASALERFEEAASLKPTVWAIQVDVADAHAWLADAQRMQRNFPDALSNRLREKEILERLASAEPANAALQQDLVGNSIGLAQIYIDRRDHAEARNALSRGVRLSSALIELDSSNVRSKGQQALLRLLSVKHALIQRVERGAPAADLAPSLQGCRLDEEELKLFCALLYAAAKSEGRKLLNMKLPNRPRLTPRWGLDLQAERAVFSKGS